MANTRNMIRLMEHAANLLDACQPWDDINIINRFETSTNTRDLARERAVAEIAAIATASTVLRMVAAAMDDEPTTPSTSEEPV